MLNETSKKIDYDEEPLKEKVKRGAGIFTIIGSAFLAVVHTLSHIVPAIGVLGLSLGESTPFYNIVSNEYMQLAYIPLVGLGFYYMYRDHQHHKHEHELRERLQKAEEELRRIKGNKKRK